MERKGRKLEMIVNDSLKKLNEKNIGYFMKSPIPNKRIPIDGVYKFIYSAKAFCDFMGIFKEKWILIECKEIADTRFPKERLRTHQVQQLLKIKQFGGRSFVFFYIKSMDKIISLDIDDYLYIERNEIKKSIHIKDLIVNAFVFDLDPKGKINVIDLLTKDI